MTTALETMRAALILRDSLLESQSWDDVPANLQRRGSSLDEIRRLLRPRIEFDPHMHTIHSDGMFTHKQLIWWCKAVGLKGIGITDHDNIQPIVADGLDEAARLGITLVPGFEFTIHRLGGQTWRGLEIGVHLFSSKSELATFFRSPDGHRFCERFNRMNRLKSEQAYKAMDLVNENFIARERLQPITRDELWQASGATDPICVSIFTVLLLKRFFSEGRQDLLQQLPDTRAIHTYLGKNGFYPPIESVEQTIDDLLDMKRELASHGIRATLTLNHPEEYLSKCGLTLINTNQESEIQNPQSKIQNPKFPIPDLPGIRRLVALLLLHEPKLLPFSFVELYSARNTPSSRMLFTALFEEFREIRSRLFPDMAELHPIASTDSHRVSGFLDANGQVQGWVPGEDFLFGLGAITHEHPSGSLEVPPDYPGAEKILALMDQCAV